MIIKIKKLYIKLSNLIYITNNKYINPLIISVLQSLYPLLILHS